jgi:2-oxoisovalerate dehydrogenase E2 component (dihydrolipoyl transacylase)
MEVKLHDIGEGMTEADISCFLVKPGDAVKADDPLVEVVTDKMTAEIPAPSAGIVRELKVEAGATVSVGTTLLILEPVHVDDQQTGIKPVISTIKLNSDQPSEKGLQTNRVLASPFTRKIAREHAVKIETITGSGYAGRITDEDVLRFIAKKEEPRTEVLETVKQVKVEQLSDSKKIPFRGRRKQIAKKMLHSLQTIPHCTHFEEVDVSELIQFRAELKKQNQDISATAFFIKVLSICLKEFPIFNAQLNEETEEIELLANHHIGIAVDTEDGLVVPVLKNVEQKRLKEIHDEMKRLTQKALKNELSIKDISDGTFTISNVGPLGGSIGATPIILHPQVALVSFHKTKKMPVVTEKDEIVIRSIMNLSMSFDHRVVDGATAVRFTNRFSHFIKNPTSLLLEMI